MLTNRISPSGISGRPTSSAAARARASKENSASWASAAAISSAAAQLDRAQLAAHQRLAAVGLAAGEVDDRLEVRRHLRRGRGTRGTSRCACGRAACRPGSAGPARRRAGPRTGRRARSSEIEPSSVLEALLPAGPGELQPLDRDVALDRLGRVVLELVEHGRAVRQQSHAVSGLAGLPNRVHPASIGANAAPLDQRARLYVVDGALAGHLDRAAERPLGVLAGPVLAQLVGEVGQEHAGARRPCGRARPPRRG